jgi:alanyl-tRNA synthetase
MGNDEYDLEYFREHDFLRRQCKKCGSFFWTRDPNQAICGDAPCATYSFIGAPIFSERSPDEVRESFLSFFDARSHTRLSRYPVVARWRDDIYLTIASIADFQPFVTSGKVPPPANPLAISQPCIRLEDLESIGRTGRHLTTFEMMGHHAFNKRGGEEIYWKNETVAYCDEFLQQLGVARESVTYKEAPWYGGGNAGPCLEVITGGLELATLVFMDLELSPHGKIEIAGQRYGKMDTYIVDTGYGLERFVWASTGTPTVYDAMFPAVITELVNAAGIEHPLETHPELIHTQASLSGALNRREIAQRVGLPFEELTRILEPIETVYAIADHTKCLAFMLADGIVPSNAKEGYLARLVLRRAFRMLKSLGIETPLEELILLQIKTLRHSFPELERSVERIIEIVSLEKQRYDETLVKGERIVKQLAKDYTGTAEREVPVDHLINLYDTHGLPPEFVKDVVASMGPQSKGLAVNIPENFYTLVAKLHSEEQKVELAPFVERLQEETKGIPATKKLYYETPRAVEFTATVLEILDDSVILDQTLFFPEGGGQPADTGYLTVGRPEEPEYERLRVIDVQSVEGVILHKLADGRVPNIPKGATVTGKIDLTRRMAHKKHHTATHIVVSAARKILGEHVWQAGAQKGEKRARIDIAHFKRISDDERRAIEMLANKIVMDDLPITTGFVERSEAEQRYGSRIYQGGVPVGEQIRIVRIGDDLDVQACAGTHLAKTGEVGPIKLLRIERIQDGVERLEYAAGEAAIEAIQAQEELIKESAAVLKVPPEKLPGVVERFFDEWKELRKETERLRGEIANLELERLEGHARVISGVNVIAAVLPDANAKGMLKIASQLADDDYVAILLNRGEARVSAVAAVPKTLSDKLHAGELIKNVSGVLGGSGGGNAELAQGGGEHVELVDAAREAGLRFLETVLRKNRK